MLCKEEETTNTTATKEKHSIGTRITKYWKGKPYKGTVTNNKDKYYKIKYDDNDEEELNHTEVTRYMEENRGNGRMIKEIGTRMRMKEILRDWNIKANESERLWPFYHSITRDILYRSYRKQWHQQGDFYYD
jgi:hypothetical protein